MMAQHLSDVFVAGAAGVAGATAGTYPLVLNANGAKVRVRSIAVSCASAGSVQVSRATTVSGGAAVTEANLNGEGSKAPTAAATKGTRSSDHTVSGETVLFKQALAAGQVYRQDLDRHEFRLSATQYLCVKVVSAANDDLVYADVTWEEL